MNIKRIFSPRALRITKKVLLISIVFHFVYLVALRWINPPITITQLTSFITGNGLHRSYLNWNDIPITAKLAVISSEDQLFADHRGFDWKSIEKAMAYNKKKPNRVRGASTISQQVAKNVFLWQGRSWVRKGLEVYFTFMIELVWGKKRILEMYLNVSEMGEGVFGIEAAAQHYFKKPAKSLTRQEASMIAACLPNPKAYTIKPMSKRVATRYPWIMVQMIHFQDDEEIE